MPDCTRVGGKCGSAGKRDWRLPNYKELTSILNLKNFDPAVSAAFNTNCVPNATVLDGSCTAALFYRSSTSDASFPSGAWCVDFFGGLVGNVDKSAPAPPRVRAVRGGACSRSLITLLVMIALPAA